MIGLRRLKSGCRTASAIEDQFASREGDLLPAVVAGARDARRAGNLAVGLRIWNPATGTLAAQSPLPFGCVAEIQFMADRLPRLVVCRSPQAGNDPRIVTLFQGVGVLDPVSGQLAPVVTDESPSIGDEPGIQLLHRAGVGVGNRIAFGVPAKELPGIVAWNNPGGVVWRPFSAQQQRAISRLAFSPYERYLVAACNPPELTGGTGDELWLWRDRILFVWPLTTDGSMSSLNQHPQSDVVPGMLADGNTQRERAECLVPHYAGGVTRLAV